MRDKQRDIKQLERENIELKQKIEFKNRQIQDLQFSLNSLKKQQCIW